MEFKTTNPQAEDGVMEVLRLSLPPSYDALEALRLLLPLWKPVSQSTFFNGEALHTLAALMTSIAQASESVLLLCIYEQLWQAEMVARSTLEATMKFCYLLQSPATFDERHSEFADDLWEIDLLRDHKKSVAMLSAVASLDEKWRPVRARLLSPMEAARIEAKFPQSRRHNLERKWGFTGLVQELRRSGDPVFANIDAMSVGYSYGSHVQHMTYTGIMIAEERSSRVFEREQAANKAHEARLISDTFAFLLLRLGVGYRFVGADVAPLQRAHDVQQTFEERSATADREWRTLEYPP